MSGNRKNIVGPSVRKARVARGLTQEALSAALQRLGWDLARGTLAKVEAGLRRVTDAELVLLAESLAVDPAEMLRDVTPAQASDVARQGRD